MNKLIAALVATLFAAGAFAQAPAPAPAKPAAAPATPATAAKPAEAAKPAVMPHKGPFGKPGPIDKGGPVGKPTPAECEAKAVSKDGKPLHGAAKAAVMKKCMGGAHPMPDHEGKPMPMPKPMEPKGGKHAQQDKMKACAAEGKGMKGPEHQKFMKECLSKK